MSLILEGPDNAGKTTLCKDLQKMCPDVQGWHAGGRPVNDEIPGLLRKQFGMAMRDDMILDRVTAISEQVYRPGKLGDQEYASWLGMVVEQVNCVIVYCKPPIDNLLNRESISFRDEEDEETRHRILDKLHEHVANYEAVMTKVPHVVYNYADELEAGWFRKYAADAFRRKDFSQLQILARTRKVY